MFKQILKVFYLQLSKIIIFFMVFCIFGSSALTEVKKPERIYGIYISKWTMYTPERFNRLVKESLEHDINTLVCDYEGEKGGKYESQIKFARSKGLYLVARIVVFEDGVGATFKNVKNPENWNKKQKWAKEAEKLGFNEVQLDYMRFEDAGTANPQKKEIVEQFLREVKASANVPVGIDVFGSVAYQPHLYIGQDLHSIADIVDVVSPMLYPSHFFKDQKRMGEPYETMLEGCTYALQQIGGRNVKMVPFIQGFAMNMSYSGLSLKDYIIAQIKAVHKSGAHGFYVWNAENQYRSTWQALKELKAAGLGSI